LHIQIAIQTISDTIFDFECRRSISKICIGSGCCELDRVGSEENENRNKKIFATAGFGESEVEEVSENIAAISNFCRGKELWSDDHLATHYSFKSATSLIMVKNIQKEEVEDEEEGGGEAAAREQDISMKIHTHHQ
jgi:hypothetical protein